MAEVASWDKLEVNNIQLNSLDEAVSLHQNIRSMEIEDIEGCLHSLEMQRFLNRDTIQNNYIFAKAPAPYGKIAGEVGLGHHPGQCMNNPEYIAHSRRYGFQFLLLIHQHIQVRLDVDLCRLAGLGHRLGAYQVDDFGKCGPVRIRLRHPRKGDANEVFVPDGDDLDLVLEFLKNVR